MTTAFHIGQRLSYDGALCTVRYHGPLTGVKGDWLGIEWDKADRGKHDGSHQGQRVFHCLSKSTTAASFVRSTRVPDPTRTVLEALKYKYGSKPALNGSRKTPLSSEVDIVHISGKRVEEVGFDKIQEQIGHFEDLKIVLLDDLNIIGLTRDDSPQAKELASEAFAKTCPNITELDLGWNLFEHWQDIADICKHLPELLILKTSGLRLSSFSVATEGPNSPFPLVEELHLNETLLTTDQILNILDCTATTKTAFPKLHTLSISLNELSEFTTRRPHLTLPTITTLILENNTFTNLHALPTIFHHFPSLTTLSLQSNAISSLTLTPPTTFPTLTHLSLASNTLPTYTTLTPLPQLFPSLTSLRTSKNPFNTTPTVSNTPNDAPYYLTLARIPSLRILNYTTITLREREEGEIYYLSVAEKDIRNIIATQGVEEGMKYAKREYSRYEELCEKYERGNILAVPPITPNGGGAGGAGAAGAAMTGSAKISPQGSLASRVVKCHFYIPRERNGVSDSDSEMTFARPIPHTIDVYTFKSLISRYYGLAPLQFKAVYESQELDPIPETTRRGNWGGAAGGKGSGKGDMGGSKEEMLKERDKEWARWGAWDVDIDVAMPGDIVAGAVVEGNGLGKDGGDGEGGDWVDGVLYRDGVRWKRRETEIVDGRRAWGDFLDGGEREVRIRVEPSEKRWERLEERNRWRREIGGGNVNVNGGEG